MSFDADPERPVPVWDRAGIVVPADELEAFRPHLLGMQEACRRLRDAEEVGDDIGVDFDPAVQP